MDYGFISLLDTFNQRWDDGGTQEYKMSLLIGGSILIGRMVSPDRFQELTPLIMKQLLDIGIDVNAEVAVVLDEVSPEISFKFFYFILAQDSIPLRIACSCVDGWSLLK